MEALYLQSHGLQHQENCQLVRIRRVTLCDYLRQYQQGRIDRLKEINFNKPQSELEYHSQSIEANFKKCPPKPKAEAQARIEQLTGIKRSPTKVRQFMKNLKIRRYKVGFVPGKSCHLDKVKEQEQFENEQLQPRLNQAKDGKRVYFLWTRLILSMGRSLASFGVFVVFYSIPIRQKTLKCVRGIKCNNN